MFCDNDNDFGRLYILLAKLSLDFFSVIDNTDKIEMYIGGHAQRVLIGFLSQFCIHQKDCWIELHVYSNIHQLIRRMYWACYDNQGWVSGLLVCFVYYLSLRFHLCSSYGCAVDFVHTLMHRCELNIQLVYLGMKEVVIL